MVTWQLTQHGGEQARANTYRATFRLLLALRHFVQQTLHIIQTALRSCRSQHLCLNINKIFYSSAEAVLLSQYILCWSACSQASMHLPHADMANLQCMALPSRTGYPLPSNTAWDVNVGYTLLLLCRPHTSLLCYQPLATYVHSVLNPPLLFSVLDPNVRHPLWLLTPERAATSGRCGSVLRGHSVRVSTQR